ncbi:MAG: hypothetical protein PVG55_05770 [Nitrospirota bacterium]
MGFRRMLIAAVVAASVLAGAASASAGEVRVVVGVGLLIYGEDARVVSVPDFNRYKPDYEEFQKLLRRSDTLAEMAARGWTVVHVEFTRDEYHVLVLERGTRNY